MLIIVKKLEELSLILGNIKAYFGQLINCDLKANQLFYANDF